MIPVTASTITLALTQDAEILAVHAMIGGFSTPALVSIEENHDTILVLLRAALYLAILAMVAFKPVATASAGRHAGNRGDEHPAGRPSTLL